MLKNVLGESPIISPQGNLTGGTNGATLYGKVEELKGEGFVNLILNLGQIKAANADGIGVLTTTKVTVENAGGKFRLAETNETVHAVLKITGMLKNFDLCDSNQAAIDSLS